MRLLLAASSTDSRLTATVERLLTAEGFSIDIAEFGDDATWYATEVDHVAVVIVAGRSIDSSVVAATCSALRRAAPNAPMIAMVEPGRGRSTTDDSSEAAAPSAAHSNSSSAVAMRPHGAPIDTLLLEAGADDVVVVPTAPAVIAARLDALVRRAAIAAATRDSVVAGRFALDRRTLTVTVDDGTETPLTPREFAVAELLARQAPDVVSKTTLLDTVWGMDADPDPNVVEVYVGYLRRKLGRSAIRTVRGAGYALDLGA